MQFSEAPLAEPQASAPAPAPASSAGWLGSRRAVWCLALFCLLYWLPTAGLSNFEGADEPRYVQVSSELIGRSNWFLLTLHGRPYDQKPPLPFWIMAGMLELFGRDHIEFATRLPGIVAAISTLLLILTAGRRLLGPRVGWLGALLLLSTAQFLDGAVEAKLDMMFTAWITFSVLAYLDRPEGRPLSAPRWLAVWGGIGAAFFTKGPLALLILLSVFAGECRGARSLRPLREARPLSGLGTVIALIALWLKAQSMSAGDAFVVGQVEGETIDRFFRGDHGAPPWYYLPRIFSSIAPVWSLLIFPIAARWWFDKGPATAGLPVPSRAKQTALVAWFILPFVILCIAHGKRESYLLPLMPPLAILLAWGGSWSLDLHARIPRLRLPLAIALVVLGLVAFLPAVIRCVGPLGIPGTDDLAKLSVASVGVLASAALLMIALSVATLRFKSPLTTWHAAHLAAALILGVALFRSAAFRPLHSARKSSRFFALAIDREFDSRPGIARELGCLERSEKPEYHVYGDYDVVPLEVDDLARADDGKLPELLLLCTSDTLEYETMLLDRGRRRLWACDVDGDELTLFDSEQ